MSADRREELSPADRQTIGFIERGEVTKACRPADTPGIHGDYDLPRRLRAGEEILRSLGMPPAIRPQTGEDIRNGILLLPAAPKARRLILVFNGNTINFSLPKPLLGLPDAHVMLIRDPGRCFGFAGIPDLGPDYPSCLANLRRLIEALDPQEVYAIGMSAGGSTALRFGTDLGVRGILGFSVPTTLDLNDDPGAELKHYPQLTALYRHARHHGIDLAKYYDRQPVRPGLILVYSEGHIRDQWLAERMSRVFGTELIRTEAFVGHKTFRWLHETGQLDQYLERLFRLQPVHKPAAATPQDEAGSPSESAQMPTAGTRSPQPSDAD